MKVPVCGGCGTAFFAVDSKGKPACPICLDGSTEYVDMPSSFTCSSCGRKSKTKDILKLYRDVPFANPSKGTYYCGCHGWD